MSTATQIERLTGARNTIRTKLVGMGLAEGEELLDELATIVNGITENDSEDLSISGGTITAPAGFYAEDATATIDEGAIEASATGSATVDSVSFAYNGTSGKFDITGSSSITGTATATVSTAGYVDAEVTGTGSTSGTASVAAEAAKIVGETALTGTKVVTPVISKTDTTASGATNVASGNASTTAPSSGYFVSVQSAENKGTLTATPSVTTAGYGTSNNHGIAGNSDTVGANASAVTYIPVAAGSATTPSTSITSNPTITVGNDGLISVSHSASESVTPTVVEGYVEAGTSGTVSVSGSATEQLDTVAATTYNTSSSDQTIAAGKFTTGVQTIKAVTTSGISAANVKSGVQVKVGDANDDDRIAGVTGTFTSASTVSEGQTAATASEIKAGYSAWVDGAEVQGTIDDVTPVEGTTSVSGSTATRGEFTWDAGFISQGSLGAATFANTATSGTTYVDISDTTDAPVLVTEDYLYINKGYVDDLKISLAKLVPDGASADLASDKILSGYSAYDNDGKLIAGNIQSLAATTYNTSSSDQTIAAGQYLSGAQTIKAVQTSGITAANVKYGVSAKVGDANDDDRILGVTGTFTGASTVSSGQTAAAAAQILENYSAWVDGEEVKGSMVDRGTVTETLDATTGKQSYTIPAGKHSGSGTVSITLEEKSATPAATAQDVTPTSGKVLSKVTVNAIPSNWGDTTGDDAVAANVLSGKKAHTIVNGVATAITGSMTNNGSISETIDGLTTLSYTIPAGYHNGSGTVSLDDSIETALAAI